MSSCDTNRLSCCTDPIPLRNDRKQLRMGINISMKKRDGIKTGRHGDKDNFKSSLGGDYQACMQDEKSAAN